LIRWPEPLWRAASLLRLLLWQVLFFARVGFLDSDLLSACRGQPHRRKSEPAFWFRQSTDGRCQVKARLTLSTVGYGDITSVSKVARMLAAMEAMTGLLYVAVLIARLVGLYSTPKSP